MIALKLIACSDRPEVRNNDLYDILRTINDLEYENNMKDHHDVIEEMSEFDERRFSARILCRKVKPCLVKSAGLKNKLKLFLLKIQWTFQLQKLPDTWAHEKG